MIYIEDGYWEYFTSGTSEINSSESVIYDVRYKIIYPSLDRTYYKFIYKTREAEIYRINKLLKRKR